MKLRYCSKCGQPTMNATICSSCREEIRKERQKSFIENRRSNFAEWKKEHPEGVNKDNIEEFKKFMKARDIKEEKV